MVTSDHRWSHQWQRGQAGWIWQADVRVILKTASKTAGGQFEDRGHRAEVIYLPKL